ncbi:MAG: radical SAM protein [Magnetococcales bacterium]|nr:radical SAM protein [Magnetococcales bacterium]
MKPFENLFFELVGSCNAKCHWCVTGGGSEYVPPKSFVDVERFAQVLDYYLQRGVIDCDTIVYLFSWGEPTLHPDFNKIIRLLNDRQLGFGLSTNASLPINLESESMSNLKAMTISMPGFSQSSYDKVHGFKIEKILINIDKILTDLKEAGFKKKVKLAFHVYQFNLLEIRSAIRHFSTRNVQFVPYLAYVNDYNRSVAYLKKTLPADEMYKLSQELLLYYVDDLISAQPADWQCPQWDVLNLDENCNVINCCSVPKGHEDYRICSALELDSETLKSIKRKSSICTECMTTGSAYWGHNVEIVEKLVNQLDNNFLRGLSREIRSQTKAAKRKLRSILKPLVSR